MLGFAAVPALAQDADMTATYRQKSAVLERYKDVPITLDTPALAPGRAAATTQDELDRFIEGLAAQSHTMMVRVLGRTPQGRNLHALTFTAEGLADPARLRARGRPIVWLIGQQHGNEPAGGEAMLAMAKALATGELKPLLDALTIVIVPRANPDGAAANTRDTAAKMDMNRDHLALTLPEVRLLHRAVQELPPDLVVDAHEFSVAARWIEKFGALQAVDLMYLAATHPDVPRAIRDLTDTVFQPALETAMRSHGLTTFLYHTTPTRIDDKSVAMGGNAAGIARNAFGLMGAVSYLLETRGVGIGLESYQRRVATHYVALKALLEAAAQNGDRLKAAVATARQSIAANRDELVVAHRVSREPVLLPLIDPETAADKPVEVAFADSRKVAVIAKRARPFGYILMPDAKDAIDELQLFGAALCRISAEVEIDGEAATVTERARADRRAINPDQSLKVALMARRVLVPAGSVFVPMMQAAGARIASALEPDAPGGFLGLEVIRVPEGTFDLPLIRVPGNVRLPLVALNDASRDACTRQP